MKNKVIEYVMNSPGNTNRAVLESLLNTIDNSGATVLKCYGHDGKIGLPFGDGDGETMFYRLWDNTPTADEMIGGFIANLHGGVYADIEFGEDDIISVEEDGNVENMYAVNLGSDGGDPFLVLVVMRVDVNVEGITIEKGIYVNELYCQNGTTPTMLVYGTPYLGT